MNGIFNELPKEVEIKFSYPSSIDFHKKTFHLSGRFEGTKASFAELLEDLGARCKGKRHERVNLNETDYFVLADVGLNKNKPNGGDKAQQVQKFNNSSGEVKIPILKESHCKQLINDYNKGYKGPSLPKP